MNAAETLASEVGTLAACRALDVSRSGLYRRRHPRYSKLQLVATGPNQVWSWDITKLPGPQKWVYYHLYVLLDIFSRLVVGWLLAERESAELAKRLIAESYAKQGIVPGQVTLHADRSTAMTAKTMAQKLADLGISESHSRPRVSNDNPFSESQFKTLKYRPEFPDRFDGHHHAESVSRELFDWYNNDQADVHYGRAENILAERQLVLDAAYAKTPERFVKGKPRVATLPDAIYINPPTKEVTIEVVAQ